MALFFALMYFAPLRPTEAVALRLDDCELPEEGWGMLCRSRSIPMTGVEWTDSGEAHESRSLKHRAKEEVRPVPACPELGAWIRQHVESYGAAPDGRLLRGTRGERLSEDACGRVWRTARAATLDTRQAASPLVKRPYVAITAYARLRKPKDETAQGRSRTSGTGPDLALHLLTAEGVGFEPTRTVPRPSSFQEDPRHGSEQQL